MAALLLLMGDMAVGMVHMDMVLLFGLFIVLVTALGADLAFILGTDNLGTEIFPQAPCESGRTDSHSLLVILPPVQVFRVSSITVS